MAGLIARCRLRRGVAPAVPGIAGGSRAWLHRTAGFARPLRPTEVTNSMMADVLQAMAAPVLIPTAICPVRQPGSGAFLGSPCRPLPALVPVREHCGANELQNLLPTVLWPLNEILPLRNTLTQLPPFYDNNACTTSWVDQVDRNHVWLQ